MEKQEFRDFCHEEFIKRGFVKKRNIYYLAGKEVLCGLHLQKSISDAYYVNCDYFIGDYANAKKYPTRYEADIPMRLCVLSKDTYEDEYFMDACISYELYTKEEIKKYFDIEFEEHIMPVIEEGKAKILKDSDYYFEELDDEEIANVLEKINAL